MNNTRTNKQSARKPVNPSAKQKSIIFGVIVLLLVGVGVIAVLTTSADSDDEIFIARRATAVGTLPTYDETAANDLAVGQPAPTIDGENFEGLRVTVSGGGTPKLLLFLADWCPHCRREVPVVVNWLASAQSPQGIDVIAVATGIDKTQPNYPPSSWLEKEKWTRPVIVDADDAVQRVYGLNAFPYYVAIKADGSVAARATGELTVEQMQALVVKATS